MTTKEKVKLIRELQRLDHQVLFPGGVNRFTEPFGLKGERRSLPSHVTACQIAEHLGIDYQTYLGEGSQLVGACEEIIQHLEA